MGTPVAFIFFCTVASGTAFLQHIFMGQFSSVSPDDQGAQEATQFAFEQMKAAFGLPMKFIRIVDAKLQIEKGAIYHITFEVEREGQLTECQVEVLRHNSGEHEMVKAECDIMRDGTDAMQVAINDLDIYDHTVQSAAAFAFDELIKKTTADIKFVKVVNAKKRGQMMRIILEVMMHGVPSECVVEVWKRRSGQQVLMKGECGVDIKLDNDLFTALDLNDTEAKSAAMFAFKKIRSYSEATEDNIILKKAQSQIDAGTRYHLVFDVSFKLTHTSCDVEVWKKESGEYELTAGECMSGSSQRRADGSYQLSVTGGYSEVDSVDQGVQQAAKYGVAAINRRLNTFMSIVKVAKALRQIHAGIKYLLTMELSEQGRHSICEAEVHRTLTGVKELKQSHCIIHIERAEELSTEEMGFQDVETAEAGAQEALHFSVEQLRKRNTQNMTFIKITHAKRKLINGEKYRLDFMVEAGGQVQRCISDVSRRFNGKMNMISGSCNATSLTVDQAKELDNSAAHFSDIGINDDSVHEVAEFGFNFVSDKADNAMKFVKIIKAQKQAAAPGLRYRVTFEVTVDGKSQWCEVDVLRKMSGKMRMTEDKCTGHEAQTEAPATFRDDQLSIEWKSLDGFSVTDLNTADVIKAAQFGVKEINTVGTPVKFVKVHQAEKQLQSGSTVYHLSLDIDASGVPTICDQMVLKQVSGDYKMVGSKCDNYPPLPKTSHPGSLESKRALSNSGPLADSEKTGSFEDVDVNDKEVVNMVHFALNEIADETGEEMILSRIVKAQALSSSYYYIAVEVDIEAKLSNCILEVYKKQNGSFKLSEKFCDEITFSKPPTPLQIPSPPLAKDTRVGMPGRSGPMKSPTGARNSTSTSLFHFGRYIEMETTDDLVEMAADAAFSEMSSEFTPPVHLLQVKRARKEKNAGVTYFILNLEVLVDDSPLLCEVEVRMTALNRFQLMEGQCEDKTSFFLSHSFPYSSKISFPRRSGDRFPPYPSPFQPQPYSSSRPYPYPRPDLPPPRYSHRSRPRQFHPDELFFPMPPRSRSMSRPHPMPPMRPPPRSYYPPPPPPPSRSFPQPYANQQRPNDNNNHRPSPEEPRNRAPFDSIEKSDLTETTLDPSGPEAKVVAGFASEALKKGSGTRMKVWQRRADGEKES